MGRPPSKRNATGLEKIACGNPRPKYRTVPSMSSTTIVPRNPELHVFADASVLAYGSAAYLVWLSSTGKEVRTCVRQGQSDPLRQTTIPRLELMAAVVASRLAKTIREEFKIKLTQVVLWSNSMIVFAWLR